MCRFACGRAFVREAGDGAWVAQERTSGPGMTLRAPARRVRSVAARCGRVSRAARVGRGRA
ncbi:hypothetical protein BLAT2472_10638 [Burkholderia latens]